MILSISWTFAVIGLPGRRSLLRYYMCERRLELLITDISFINSNIFFQISFHSLSGDNPKSIVLEDLIIDQNLSIFHLFQDY